MFKAGDAVLIKGAISDVHEGTDNPYFVAPNPYSINWVSEDKIIPADKTYEQGLADAWELAKKVYEMDCEIIGEIFGLTVNGGFWDVSRSFTAAEALAKIEAYEREKEIKVGDEVKLQDGSTFWIIAITNSYVYGYSSDGKTADFPVQKLEGLRLTKTGRTTDSIDLLRQIGE